MAKNRSPTGNDALPVHPGLDRFPSEIQAEYGT